MGVVSLVILVVVAAVVVVVVKVVVGVVPNFLLLLICLGCYDSGCGCCYRCDYGFVCSCGCSVRSCFE